MTAMRENRLPLALAALPFLAFAFNLVCQLDLLSPLRPLAETLIIAFLVPPLLFFDQTGLIRWNLFAGDPKLFGSAWAADAVYALSSSLLLFFAGKLLLRLSRLWR
jgi:hypothetical protein